MCFQKNILAGNHNLKFVLIFISKAVAIAPAILRILSIK